MSDITDEIRAQIIALKTHTTKSGRQIAADLGLNHQSVNRIIKRYEETGSYYSDRGNCHRPRKTDERDDRVLLRLSRDNPKASSSDLASELKAFHNISIDSSTVRRRLLENGRPAYRPIQCQLLTNAMKQKRLQWCREHEDWDIKRWSRVMFSDESSIELQPHRSQYVRRDIGVPPSGDHFQAVIRHPVKVMIWSCISVYGTGRVHVVENSMDANQYLRVLSERAVPQMREWFGSIEGWFQQDLAPCHTAKRCAEFLQNQNVKVLEWPGNSPDLSPIENIWAVLKKRVNKQECKNKQDLINAVLNVWTRSNELNDMCEVLIASMPDRIKACIKAGGGPIDY